MKELLAVNGNLLFIENKDNEKEPVYEVVIITSEPRYTLNNESGLNRARTTDELRFFVRDKYLEKFVAEILSLRKLKEDSQKQL